MVDKCVLAEAGAATSHSNAIKQASTPSAVIPNYLNVVQQRQAEVFSSPQDAITFFETQKMKAFWEREKVREGKRDKERQRE